MNTRTQTIKVIEIHEGHPDMFEATRADLEEILATIEGRELHTTETHLIVTGRGIISGDYYTFMLTGIEADDPILATR